MNKSSTTASVTELSLSSINPDQANSNGDCIGHVCDNCSDVANSD